ncbi:TLD domain-containing protein 2-like [Hoplias malabaricus]|uniref:TLD domain-containing protein 2-like n=1 Tax=Hoplias malabaricus TaxID=27720 RepID=UPI003461838B
MDQCPHMNILGLEEFDFSPLCDLKLSEGSILLNISQIQELCQQLPANLSLCEWRLTFRTQTHGTSLRTLYKTSSQLDACSVLIIRDSYRQVFGVVCSAPLRVSTAYYGTGQTFVFSFSPHLQVYKWTGGNSFFIKGSVDSLHFGGGRGRYGLWINGDLIRGRSQTCETFDNEVLSSTEDFLINELEVWTLV